MRVFSGVEFGYGRDVSFELPGEDCGELSVAASASSIMADAASASVSSGMTYPDDTLWRSMR